MESHCMTNEEKIKHKTPKLRILIILVFVALLVIGGITCLLVGIIKYNSRLQCVQGNKEHLTEDETLEQYLDLNVDQKNLEKFTKKVKDTFYFLYPHKKIFDPSSENNRDIFYIFEPYDSSWLSIKNRTDVALNLKLKLHAINVTKENLRPRERKAFSQLNHYLDSIFGHPFDENYYTGDWMLGPNFHCWQPLCEIGQELLVTFNIDAVVPRSLQDVERLMHIVKLLKRTIENVQENMILGVKAGMVRSVDACAIGRSAFEQKFPMVKMYGKHAVLMETSTMYLTNSVYYSKLSDRTKEEFQNKYKKSVKDKISQILVNYFGAPLHKFMRFLQYNHSRHCVPSSVASGLANLPVQYVWLDEKQTKIKTTQKLPTGEMLIGANSYQKILPYFTTMQTYNATYIAEQGQHQLQLLFQRAINIAKKVTKENSTSEAIRKFQADLSHPRHYFNTSVIPHNESGIQGGKRCNNMEMARKNCPVRYEAMQNWMKYTYQIMSRIEALTVSLFYITGKKSSTPSCPVKLGASFDPNLGTHYYEGGGPECEIASQYTIPFFLDKPGPKYTSFSLIGHETRPGHHTQMQGFYERFQQSGNNDIFDWLNINTFYSAFTEGWALYAENPLLSSDTSLYEDEPFQEYGMLKLQIWRALRMVIDTGLHVRGMTLKQSLELFKKYAWDTSDKAFKDTVRYMALPGQATSYMIGQIALWSMRNKTEAAFRKAGIIFELKEFHYKILSQGSAPLDYLMEYMDNYIQCKIDPFSRNDCFEVLIMNDDIGTQTLSSGTRHQYEQIGTKQKWKFIIKSKNKMTVFD